MISKKEAVLEAAKELFAEYGYIQTTFAMIAKKAAWPSVSLRITTATKRNYSSPLASTFSTACSIA